MCDTKGCILDTKVCILDYAYNYINQTYNINNMPIISREEFKNKCFEIIKNKYNTDEKKYKEYIELYIYVDKDELYRDYKYYKKHNMSFEKYCYNDVKYSPLHKYIRDLIEEIEEEQKLYIPVSKKRRLIEYERYYDDEGCWLKEKEYNVYKDVNNDIIMDEEEEYKKKDFFTGYFDCSDDDEDLDDEDLNNSSDDEEDSDNSSDIDEDLDNNFSNMSI